MQQTRTEISDLIVRLSDCSGRPTDECQALINRLLESDRELGLTAEAIINRQIFLSIQAGFSLGWHSGRNPDLLIFPGA
jgi:hypothetical protein